MRTAPFFLMLCLTGAVRGEALFDGADPHAARIGDAFWIYPTEPRTQGPIFTAYRSTDLKTWKREGVVLELATVPWVMNDGRAWHGAWAPAIAAKNGRFYFYYSVGPQTPEHPSRIGVATGDSPAGPFKDSGAPMPVGGEGFEAIDPMVFTDPRDGKSYLYAGGSAGSRLKVYELEDDMVRIRREIEVGQLPHFTEGAFVHVRRGLYYLSYSHGRWNDSSYCVHYATSASATGPWKYGGLILQSDETHQGPGHHSFVENPATGEWFIVYHRWETREKSGTYKGSRKVAMEKVEYDSEGGILPVRMTD